MIDGTSTGFTLGFEVESAAKMAISSDVDAQELRRQVTSPAGTTEAAIKSLEQDGLAGIFMTALTAARDRSIELAKEMAS